jgi:hypothetical protein
MANPPRKIGFVLAATEHGTMIFNRFDYHRTDNGTYGVGHVLLSNAIWQPGEIGSAVCLLAARRAHFGDGVMAIDCGANIGTHTLEWAWSMTGWGSVIAIEGAGAHLLRPCRQHRAEQLLQRARDPRRGGGDGRDAARSHPGLPDARQFRQP